MKWNERLSIGQSFTTVAVVLLTIKEGDPLKC